jgi:hypothetical protein
MKTNVVIHGWYSEWLRSVRLLKTSQHTTVPPRQNFHTLDQGSDACVHIPCFCISLSRRLHGTTPLHFHVQTEVHSTSYHTHFLSRIRVTPDIRNHNKPEPIRMLPTQARNSHY